jgi:hypothetical protein
MSWSPAIYVQFPDEATARVAAVAIGVDFPADGSVPTGNANYAMHAPMQNPWLIEPVTDPETGEVITPGEREPGYWAMLRLNTEWPGFAEAWAAIQATGAVRELENPPVVWA